MSIETGDSGRSHQATKRSALQSFAMVANAIGHRLFLAVMLVAAVGVFVLVYFAQAAFFNPPHRPFYTEYEAAAAAIADITAREPVLRESPRLQKAVEHAANYGRSVVIEADEMTLSGMIFRCGDFTLRAKGHIVLLDTYISEARVRIESPVALVYGQVHSSVIERLPPNWLAGGENFSYLQLEGSTAEVHMAGPARLDIDFGKLEIATDRGHATLSGSLRNLVLHRDEPYRVPPNLGIADDFVFLGSKHLAYFPVSDGMPNSADLTPIFARGSDGDTMDPALRASCAECSEESLDLIDTGCEIPQAKLFYNGKLYGADQLRQVAPAPEIVITEPAGSGRVQP